MARGQTMRAIEEAISRLETEKAALTSQIDFINGRISAFRESLAFHNGTPIQPSEPEVRTRARRGNLKETVLSLAEEVGHNGLTADRCVSLAKQKNIDLVHSSVSSLLSRLKTDGVLFFDGQVYRLKQYAGPRQAA